MTSSCIWVFYFTMHFPKMSVRVASFSRYRQPIFGNTDFVGSEVTASLLYLNSSNFASNPSPWTHSDNDVMTWKPFPHYYPHARGIHWSPVNSFHKELPCGALIFSSLYAQTRLNKQLSYWWFEIPWLSCNKRIYNITKFNLGRPTYT